MVKTYIEQVIEAGIAVHGDKFDASDLDERFVRYYFSKERVKIKDSSGKIMYGIVDKTTGWKPVFLLMYNSRSFGSGELIGQRIEIIGVQQKGFKKYSKPY